MRPLLYCLGASLNSRGGGKSVAGNVCAPELGGGDGTSKINYQCQFPYSVRKSCLLFWLGTDPPFRCGGRPAAEGVTRLTGGGAEYPSKVLDTIGGANGAGAVLSKVAEAARGIMGADLEGGGGGAREGDSGELERRVTGDSTSDNTRTLDGGTGGPSTGLRLGGGGTALPGVDEAMLDGRGGGGGAGRPGRDGAGRPGELVEGVRGGIPGTGREIGDTRLGDSARGELLLGGSGGRAGVLGGLKPRTGARRGGTGALVGGVGTDLGGGGGTTRPGKLGGAREGRVGGSAKDPCSAGAIREGGTDREGVVGGRGAIDGKALAGAGGGIGLAGAGLGVGTGRAETGGGVGVGTARASPGGGIARAGAGGGAAGGAAFDGLE